MAPPSKRRKTEPKIEEISFDDSARHDYLTGFHKRKVQRAKHAQEIAERKAREERIEVRKKAREERKADLERHVKEINALFRPVEDEEEVESENGERDGEGVGAEWKGFEEVVPPVDHEAEYIDEDKYTTVTVETMDVSKEGLLKLDQGEDASKDEAASREAENENKTDKRKNKSAANRPRSEQSKIAKKKRKNFRYESKAERKVSRTKQQVKNSKQAKARRDG